MNLENIEDLLLDKKTLSAERLKKFDQIEQKHSSTLNCHLYMKENQGLLKNDTSLWIPPYYLV